ncbi:MAG: TolC family protein [Alistipes sp.]|nr:TolC family protein [Candidatus Alistipes equi]
MKKIVLLFTLIVLQWSTSAQDTGGVELNLSLEEALQIALSENPTIKIANKEIEIKKYAKRGTYAALYPQIDATGTYQRVIEKQTMSMSLGGQTQSIKVGSDNSFSGGITAAMPLINAQLWTSLKLSALDVELSVEKARSSKIDMIEQVTAAYYTVLLSKELLLVFQRVYDNAVANNREVKKKFDVGIVSEYDLITSNVSVKNAEPNVTSAKNNITLALWQLKALLGIDLNKNIDVKGSLMDYVPAMEKAVVLSDLNLENNTTLRQMEIQDEQLQKAVKLTKLANVPTLSINAAYLYSALGNDGKFFVRSAWNPYSYAGLQFNVPIFAGLSKRSATKQAKLNLENLRLQKENVERNLRVQMIQSFNNMQTYVKQYHSASATVSQAQRGYDIAAKRYEVGSGTLLEIDNSQVALTQSELSRSQAIYEFLNSKLSLDKIIGHLENK